MSRATAAPSRATVPKSLTLPDLTIPRDDTRTLRELVNRQSRDLLRRLLAVPPGLLRPELAPLHQAALAVYRGHIADDPRPLVRILRQPTHSALLVTLSRQWTPSGDHAAMNAWLAELHLITLLELAALGELKQPFDIPRRVLPNDTWPVLRSLFSRMELTLDGDVEAVRMSGDGLSIRKDSRVEDVAFDAPEGPVFGGRVRRPYHVIDGNILLAVSDNNPLSHFEAHPDKSGNTVDLGGREAGEWVEVLRRCLALVDEHLPLIGQEMRLLLRLVVPVGWHETRHLSASYQEAVGTVYLTLHPNLMTMVEALVHEFQHNKLNVAFNLDPLLENGFSPLYTSPVRPDPRPLHGVVLAVHAFQPVAKLYERMLEAGHPFSRNPRWKERFRSIVAMNEAGAKTVLDNARATPSGVGLFEEMRELDSYFRSYAARRWPDAPDAEVVDLG